MNRSEWQELVSQMEALIYRGECCSDARSTLGHALIDARSVVDRMQYLLDREYLRTHDRNAVAAEVTR